MNPLARGMFRAFWAACGTVIRSNETALPRERAAYTSYVPGARPTEYEPFDADDVVAAIAPPPRAVNVTAASTPNPPKLTIPETVVLSRSRETDRSNAMSVPPGATVRLPVKAYV